MLHNARNMYNVRFNSVVNFSKSQDLKNYNLKTLILTFLKPNNLKTLKPHLLSHRKHLSESFNKVSISCNANIVNAVLLKDMT